MKMDPAKYGKENILVMTDTFSKFSVAVIMQNQQTETVAKAQTDKRFYTYVISVRIHNDQGNGLVIRP